MQLIQISTSALQSQTVSLIDGESITLVITGADLGATEFIDIQYWTGTAWKDLWQNADKVRLGATNNAIRIAGPLTFRADKDATVAASGMSAFRS